MTVRPILKVNASFQEYMNINVLKVNTGVQENMNTNVLQLNASVQANMHASVPRNTGVQHKYTPVFNWLISASDKCYKSEHQFGVQMSVLVLNILVYSVFLQICLH